IPVLASDVEIAKNVVGDPPDKVGDPVEIGVVQCFTLSDELHEPLECCAALSALFWRRCPPPQSKTLNGELLRSMLPFGASRDPAPATRQPRWIGRSRLWPTLPHQVLVRQRVASCCKATRRPSLDTG